MRLQIQMRKGKPDHRLVQQVERRLYFALSRFGDRIQRAVIRLADLNGPRGGIDQHCRIEVALSPSGTLLAEATDADTIVAVGLAADRIARRVRDALQRRHTLRTRRARPLRDYRPTPRGLRIDEHRSEFNGPSQEVDG